MPVPDEMWGGKFIVNSGSPSARLGIKYGLKITVFRFVFSMVMTAERDTSLPVPDVVATAMYGGKLDEIRFPPSSKSSYSASGASCVIFRRMALAASSGDPPPSPTIPSHLDSQYRSTPSSTF